MKTPLNLYIRMFPPRDGCIIESNDDFSILLLSLHLSTLSSLYLCRR
jgi:hypothetical protein